jgi:Protein of unknown function (DUF2384)
MSRNSILNQPIGKLKSLLYFSHHGRIRASADNSKIMIAIVTTQSNSELTEFPPPARLMSISAHAGEVFANQERAIHWLRSPNPSLGGKTPLQAAQIDKGYRDVDDVLVRIEQGVLG